jgi:hypothetical protein
MWILEQVRDKNQGHLQARCYACGYTFNADIFTRDNIEMIMEAHKCRRYN